MGKVTKHDTHPNLAFFRLLVGVCVVRATSCPGGAGCCLEVPVWVEKDRKLEDYEAVDSKHEK